QTANSLFSHTRQETSLYTRPFQLSRGMARSRLSIRDAQVSFRFSTGVSVMKRVILAAALAVGAIVTLGPAAWPKLGRGPTKATANATVQPGGPRAAPNGTNFFNVEGNSNGPNASFGTADFARYTIPGGVFGVNSVTVSLTESNAAFTLTGPLN